MLLTSNMYFRPPRMTLRPSWSGIIFVKDCRVTITGLLRTNALARLWCAFDPSSVTACSIEARTSSHEQRGKEEAAASADVKLKVAIVLRCGNTGLAGCQL